MDKAVKNEPFPEEDGMKPDNRSKGGRPEHRGQDNRRGRGGGGANMGGNYVRKDFVKERLENMCGPTTNLQSKEGVGAKKFTGRCRLFVGNLPNNIVEEEFRKMFTQFGEIAEVFLNKQKGFGFVKLDTRQNAEAAKTALDYTMRDGKYLRVRFATPGAALKIKNLSPWVSNELLEAAFGIFGDVERAVVIVDDRGRPVGEGIVEYARKQSAQLAQRRCTEGCFLLTNSPRPVLVEPLEQRDEEDGLPEKNFQKSNKQYLKEREVGPRLAEPGSFEFDFSNRWKKLFALEQQKRDHLEKEIEEGRHALDEQMEYSIYEHEANLLRERLRHMEEQSTLLQRERELRQFNLFRREEEMRREESRRQQEMMLRQQQEEILRRCGVDDMRRRQEDTLMLQEAAMRQMQGSGGMSPGGMGSDHMGNPNISGYGPSGPGPNGMMPGGGMGMQPRQSRFDQPPMGPGFPQGNDPMNEMGGPPVSSAGGNMRGGRDMRGVPHEMMENMEEYPMDAKRRRY